MAPLDKYVHAFQQQLENVIAMPVENGEELLDLPTKAKHMVLTDIYTDQFMRNDPRLLKQPIEMVRGAVLNYLRQQGII